MAKYLDNSGLARVWDKVKSYVSGLPFVRYDSQSLSDAYKLQARTNIDAAKSDAHTNDNLLDNWYFVGGGSQLDDGVFPINQRGQTSYSANAYGIDRWICYGGTQTVWSGGVIIPANGVMTQPTNNLAQLNGETLTLSILYEDRLDIGTATLDLSGTTMFINNDGRGQAYITSSGLVQFYRDIANTIKAVKLEKGTVSTLANDVPPDFGEELAKCQRRLFIRDYVDGDVIANGLSLSATYSIFNLALPVSMASGGTPTATVTVNPLVLGGGTGEQSNAFGLQGIKGNSARLYVGTTVMPTNQAAVLYANTNIRLTISNEL